MDEGVSMKARLSIALSVLVLFVGLLQMCVHVQALGPIVVLDHGFAKGYRYTSNGNVALINRTSSFTQDDVQVNAYALATFYSVNITWNWYDPAGS